MSNEIDVRLIGNYTVELNEQGPPGAPGLGIASVSELDYNPTTGVYTYRITYTDGTYYDFDIHGTIEYTAGDGINITGATVSIDNSVIPTKTEIQNELLEKQDKIDSSNKLSSDLVSDVGNSNKFATQSQLNQISTNQSDISTINSKISDSASSSNKLIDKNYVDAEDGDLQDQINNLKARGRFLALWNCATGLAETNPPQSPYLYQTGDYFIVGNISDANPQVNYKPNGSSYTTGVASSTLETNVVDIDDVYYYDGTNWHLQVNTQKTVSFVNIAGSPYDNTNLSTALNSKQDTSTAVTHTASTGVGSATKGVYIASDGTATATTYSVEKDVPSNAVFTDTTYTFSTGLTNTSDTITVNDYDKLVKNTATGNNSIVIGENNSAADYSVSIGDGGSGNYCSVSIGRNANADTCGIALGYNSNATGLNSIQIGPGSNSSDNKFKVAFGNSANNYEILDGTTGLIPDARISSNIARTSAIPTVNDGTITLTQGGITKGSFTVNQSGNTTIDLDTGGSSITIDDHLDDASTNPVENRVITNELKKKQDLLTGTSSISIYRKTFSIPTRAIGTTGVVPMIYDGSRYFGLTQNSGYTITSTNGSSFTLSSRITNLRYRNWTCLAYDGTTYITIDGYGYISKSTDRTSWSSASQISGLSGYSWVNMIYDGSKFILLGSTGYISTSTDGTTWTTPTSALTNKSWRKLIYNGTKYLAISSTGYISTSTNGTTWTTPVLKSELGNNAWNCLAYNGTIYVAMGEDGCVSTSTNGSDWSVAGFDKSLDTDAWWQNIIYANNKFLAYDSNVYVSTWDGILGDLLIETTPDSSLSSTSTNAVQNKTIYNALNNKQNSFSTQSPLRLNNNTLYLTVDSQLDQNSYNPVANSAIYQAINNIHIPEYQAGTSISIAQGQLSYDFDSQNVFMPTQDTTQWHDITYNNGVYVAVGEFEQVITSTDGENWDLVHGQSGGWGGDTLTGVAYDGTNLCVVMTEYGSLYCSQDFDIWNTDQIQDVGHLNAIVYGNNTFVIVGQDFNSNGLISYGSGAQGDWSNVATPQTIANVWDVIYDGTRFIAGCSLGYIGVSSDGASWTFTQIDNSQNDIKNIAYNGTDYVAIVDNNLVLKSSDLTTWTATRVNSIGNNDMIDSAGGNGYFIFLAEDFQVGEKVIYVSSDGATWDTYSLQSMTGTYCIAKCGDDFLIGQEWGYIVSIDGDSGLVINCLIDNQLDPVSTNPVQNCVLYNIIGDIETLLQGI